MEKLKSQEIEKVFGMYLFSKLLYPNQDNPESSGYCYGIDIAADEILVCDQEGQAIDNIPIHECYLHLTPITFISDEHAKQACKMEIPVVMQDMYSTDGIAEYLSANIYSLKYPTYIYLINNGYSVPLYFAPCHWANGKTAIELGIAIDKSISTNN